MTARVTIMVQEKAWKSVPGLASRLRGAARAALAHEGRNDGALTLLLADDERLRALNRDFRGKDKPTNVLSFPGGAGEYLGDIAIAYGTAAREADAEGKALADHVTHLAVHGVLHLLGYDHETARDAARMEPLETRLLGAMGIADPYRAPAAPAHSRPVRRLKAAR